MNDHALKRNIFSLCFARGIYAIGFGVIFISLALYLNTTLHISEQTSAQITAIFLTLNFGLPLLGGWLGNNFINFKKLYLCGLMVQTIGYILISQITTLAGISIALALLLNGSLASSVCMVEFISNTVESRPEYRRTAMLLNYGSLNGGFVIGSIIAGIFGYAHLYRVLLIFLALCPLLSVFIIYKFFRYNNDNDNSNNAWVKFFRISIPLTSCIGLLIYFTNNLSNYLLGIVCIGLVTTIYYANNRSFLEEKANIKILSFFMMVSMAFWAIYMLTPTMIMYLIKDWVDLKWNSFPIQPQWLDIDPLIVMLGSPLLAYILMKINSKYKIKISTFTLFSLALIVIAFGAYQLAIAIDILNPHQKLSISCAVLYISCLALGELLLAPEGYTLPGRLAPRRMRGLLTGAWITSVSAGTLISSSIAHWTLKPTHRLILIDYHQVFYSIAFVSALLAASVFLLGLYYKPLKC